MSKSRAHKMSQYNDGNVARRVGLLSDEGQAIFCDNYYIPASLHVTAKDLLEVPQGDVTRQGLELNIDVGIQYLESWLRGNGCVPIYNLMEDAATAEISRAQLWQWAHHGAKLKDGETIDVALVNRTIPGVLDRLRDRVGADRFENGKYKLAAKLFEEMTAAPEFPEFLTPAAYEWID